MGLVFELSTKPTPLIKDCLYHLQDYAKLLKLLKHFPLLDEQIARHRHDNVARTYNQMIMLM